MSVRKTSDNAISNHFRITDLTVLAHHKFLYKNKNVR